MAELDLMPPPKPGEEEQEQKEGFISRFLFKHKKSEDAHEEDAHAYSEEIDLDEVKRKLGLHEDAPVVEPKIEEPPLSSFEPPSEISEPEIAPEPVDIGDWTEHDTTPVEPTTPGLAEETPEAPVETKSEWETPEETGGEHHDVVDKHFSAVNNKHEEIKSAVEEHEPKEWHLQDAEVKPGQYFILKNGHEIRSLVDLMDALEFIDDSTFEHHMNEHQNDFANWIRNVLKNEKLADAFQENHTREHATKVLKTHRKKAAKKLEKHTKTHKSKVQKLEKMDKKLGHLSKQIKEKSAALENEKHVAHKRAKAALDHELDSRIVEERHALEQELTKAQEMRVEAEKILSKAEATNEKFDKRKTRAAEREEALKEQHRKLNVEKKEAVELLKEAKKVERDLKGIERHKVQVQKHLKDISKRETGISRQEETLNQREKKMSTDMTKLSQMNEEMSVAKADFKKREAALLKKEADTNLMIVQAEKRSKEFKKHENKSVDRIRAEKKKLDVVRKKIETALKKVIKNKNKAMHAKKLREELEKHVLDIKEDIVSEHKNLDDDSFKRLMESKKSTTPIGQPSSKKQDDVKNVKNLALYKKVEKARKALEQKDLLTAKKLYAEIRDEFGKQKMKDAQKNTLYIAIRELYDDIHLAMLE